MKVKVIFKDPVTSIPRFTNFHETGLRRSESLQKGNSAYDGDGIVHNMFTIFSIELSISSSEPKSMLQIILCTQKKARSLIENMINQVSEYLLRSIDNVMNHFKDILSQAERSEFIKAIETKIYAHQRMNYWQIWKLSDVKKGMNPKKFIWSFKLKRLTPGDLLEKDETLHPRWSIEIRSKSRRYL